VFYSIKRISSSHLIEVQLVLTMTQLKNCLFGIKQKSPTRSFYGT
jgi:hypothetical protein